MLSQNHIITRSCKAVFAALLVNLCINTLAWAESEPEGYSMQTSFGSDGLAIRLPVISQAELLATLNLAHNLLSKQERQAQQVIDNSSKGKDAVIAAVMPGGLLYYAYQKQKLSHAENTLSEVTTELNRLDVDAVTLYDPVGAIVIARHP